MLMQLGEFAFERKTLAPSTMEKQITLNWAKQNRFKGRPSNQFTGIDGETLNLSGEIYPFSDITGTAKDLDLLNEMSVTGENYVLVRADGKVFGVFGIKSISETHTHIVQNGEAQKIEFQINLVRTDNDRIDNIL